MPVAIGGHRKLHRHERLRAKLIEEKLWADHCGPTRDGHMCFRLENVRNYALIWLKRIVADDTGQEIVDYDPLVVPPDQLLGTLEYVIWGCGLEPLIVARANPVNRPVVQTDEGGLQLADDLVLVVAWVSDDGAVVFGTWQIALVLGTDRLALDELDAVVRVGAADRALVLIQVRLVLGSATVEIIEVELGSPEVDQRIGVVLARQRRNWIEGNVVVDELTEVGVAGWQAQLPVG